MSKRRRTEAYTLIEMMIVVVIIGIFAGLAGPRIFRQLAERRVNEIQLGVVRHFREARAAAVGYGHAYRVVFSSTGQGSLTLERGRTNRCNSNAETDFVLVKTFRPESEQRAGAPVAITLENPDLDGVELCFQPTGVTYWRTGTARFTDRSVVGGTSITGGFVFAIAETGDTGGVVRRAVLPLGSDARVLR